MDTELKEGKYAYALIYSAYFIALCFVLKESLCSLTELLIPFETINFFIFKHKLIFIIRNSKLSCTSNYCFFSFN